MGYWITLREPVGGEIIQFGFKHQMFGSNIVIGGSPEAEITITYNYSSHFRRVMGEEGIRTIYGMTGAESIPVIKKAMAALKNDASPDYWEPTEGNAKRALAMLLAFAQMRPDGVWEGD